MPDNPEGTVSYEHLLMFERRGMPEIPAEGSNRFYNVKDLLGTVQNEREPLELILELLRENTEVTEETREMVRPDLVEAKLGAFGVNVDLKAVADRFKKK